MKQILVLQRGWVAVGDVEKSPDEIVVKDASIVRRWGTTNGLGQLAQEGPTKETILDPAGTLRVHPLAVVVAFDCRAEAWAR